MKVFHLINTLSAGGAELHLLTLCRSLRRQGVELVVAYLREHARESRSLHADFEKEALSVIHLHAESRYDWRFFGRLYRLLKQEQPDILHTHLPRADLAGAFGRLLNPSLIWICSVHGLYSESWAGKWTMPLVYRVWQRADAVVAISHAVKQWLQQKSRVPSEKIAVIHYGIAPERFAEPLANWRRTANVNGQAVIGSLGRLESGKGHADLIRAMPTILQRIPQACLLIAGHDPWGYGRVLQALIEQLELHDKVRLIGFQNDVASFLGALDVFAFASRSEGFGQVVIEAMAARKPVVASNTPPLTEIVVDQETGLLVAPEQPAAFAQAISWLLDHPEKAQQMGERGRERVRDAFAIERETSQTLSLYKALVE